MLFQLRWLCHISRRGLVIKPTLRICCSSLRNRLKCLAHFLSACLPACLPTYLPTHPSIYNPCGTYPFFFRFITCAQSVGLLRRVISPLQGRYVHTKQHKHKINSQRHHASSGIRTHDPSVWAGEDSSCIRPHGYWDGSSYWKCVHCKLGVNFPDHWTMFGRASCSCCSDAVVETKHISNVSGNAA
jgi:hypothetical protein